ncbi:GH3 auxin-responsive promoter family protein [Nguyenibacter sp. L1]|uniref:GH3 family domain-containing protein n=1 Tax=Nguyenibacter sp. L1 TaxID=3049350 RepID=UPI002B4A7795|nr:GH3 auxin-responsive promoter family protein [Nguyenibacter sp. L1]WRH88941.1 GH3 auxin-responsive promoter family protein [Nguyenibacter sp. L1]
MATTDWSLNWFDRRSSFIEECNAARNALIDDLADGAATQQRVLDDIYRVCGPSQSWQQSGYSDAIRRGATFREIVPIRTYADFEPLIDSEVHTKGGVLSTSPVRRWLKTSGTTGKPKRIPYTDHWMTAYRVPAMKAMWGTFLLNCPELLAHPYATFDTQTVREVPGDHIFGVPYQGISNRNPPLGASDWTPPWYEAPWYIPSLPSDHLTKMYYRLRWLVTKDVRFLTAINPSTILSILDSLRLFASVLVKEIADGSVAGINMVAPDPEAARRLEKILGRSTYSLNDVWPNLMHYSTWASAAARLYDAQMLHALPCAKRLPFMSCGTEGVVTIPLDGSQLGQPLAVDQAWFEFIPAEDEPNEYLSGKRRADTLLYDELDVGKEYHVIMSQLNGLTRLYTGDIFSVEKIEAGVPYIYFTRRHGVYHSFTGEKLTEVEVVSAIERGLAQFGAPLGLFLCGARWGSPPGYSIAIELHLPRKLDVTEIATAIDLHLQHISIEYASKRESGRLDGIQVALIQHQAIAKYVESKRNPGNTTQYKYKPFHKDTSFLDELVRDNNIIQGEMHGVSVT